MIYTKEVENMCPVAQGVNHGCAPIPEEAKWVKAKEVKDISGFTHGIGWCAPQQGACKLSLNIKEGIIQEALVETIGCSGRYGLLRSVQGQPEVLGPSGKPLLPCLSLSPQRWKRASFPLFGRVLALFSVPQRAWLFSRRQQPWVQAHFLREPLSSAQAFLLVSAFRRYLGQYAPKPLALLPEERLSLRSLLLHGSLQLPSVPSTVLAFAESVE